MELDEDEFIRRIFGEDFDSESDEDFLREEILGSESEEEEEEDDDSFTPEQFEKSIGSHREQQRHFYNQFPIADRETDRPTYLCQLLFYSVKYVLMLFKYDGPLAPHNPVQDAPEITREKFHFEHARDLYTRLFVDEITELGDNIYNLVYDKIEDYLGDEAKGHVLIYLLDKLAIFKEMHSRRLKTNPGVGRTKQDMFSVTYNAVTREVYDPKNPDHKNWKTLIFNPNPSDFDYRERDPGEWDLVEKVNREVDKLNGNYNVPDPFSVVVTREFEKLFRILHSALHFLDYFHTYTVGCVTDDEWAAVEELLWEDTWKHLVGEKFHTKPIEKFSREKKKVPELVSRMAELRDFLKELILFV